MLVIFLFPRNMHLFSARTLQVSSALSQPQDSPQLATFPDTPRSVRHAQVPCPPTVTVCDSGTQIP